MNGTNIGIWGRSVAFQQHSRGLVLYWLHKSPSLKVYHNVALLDMDYNVLWHKRFHEAFSYWNNTGFKDGDIYVKKNGDIHILANIDRGEKQLYFRLDEDGQLLENYILNKEEVTSSISAPRPNELLKSGQMVNDGFLSFAHTTKDSSTQLIVQHLPLDTSLFSCNILDIELEEIFPFAPLTEAYFQEEFVIEDIDVQLKDAELYVEKGFYEREVWCEQSYSLEDYSIHLIDTLCTNADELTITLDICRKDNSTVDTISLLHYPYSPLDTFVVPSTMETIHFGEGETCTTWGITTTSGQHHFILNTRLDYDPPFTLMSTFFDAHDKMEFEYQNNYLAVVEDCQMVAAENIERTSDILRVFPNPTNNNINIILSNQEIRTAELYSTTGKFLIEIENTGNDQKVIFDLSDYNQGIYFLKVSTAEGEYYWERLVIQR